MLSIVNNTPELKVAQEKGVPDVTCKKEINWLEVVQVIEKSFCLHLLTV